MNAECRPDFQDVRQRLSASSAVICVVCVLRLVFGTDGVAAESSRIRVATFNVSFNRPMKGELRRELSAGSESARRVAKILRTVRPDIVLLNEFDHDPTALTIFQKQYLEDTPENTSDKPPLIFPYVFTGTVNTGIASGLDLNQNGQSGDPADCYGFGAFPGQYGMVVLSRYPIDQATVRTFQQLKWSVVPDAAVPKDPVTGDPWYPLQTWNALRLSSKSHWDIPVRIKGHMLSILASHPTPPAFDGPEDRNGCRNRDEIRFWTHYLSATPNHWIQDDAGGKGGRRNADFVIVGDLNADPNDGGSQSDAIQSLLKHPLVRNETIPRSEGGVEASKIQQKANVTHQGDPAFDTADFSDRRVGNLRVDYVLPSRTLQVLDSGVFWPKSGEELSDAIGCSDHRLVWVDLQFPDDGLP